MKSVIVIASLALFLAGTLIAADRAAAPVNQYKNTVYGFALTPPTYPPATSSSTMVVMFPDMSKNGFSSNVNVMIQQRKTTRKEYMEVSTGEFAKLHMTVIASKELVVNGLDASLFEYEGAMQGRSLHWLSLAVFDKNRVVLMTCTASAEEFKNVEKAFRASVDSFELTPAH